MRRKADHRLLTLLGVAIVFLILGAAAFAADPTDSSYGVHGIAEIEARVSVREGADQVGGIVDLAKAKGEKLLAAVYPIAEGGHYFAAARIDRDGSLDKSFGKEGFTPYIDVDRRRGETSGGVLRAEAVAEQPNGDVVLAGYFDNEGATAPALVRFRPDGSLDPSFGSGGKVIPRPTSEGRRIPWGEVGGERIHDIAVAPNGDIVAVGGNNEEKGQQNNKNPTALVTAYLPDGKIDSRFGHSGRFKVKAPRKNAFTGFSQVQALPSGKLLVSGYVRQQIVLYRLTAKGQPDKSFGGGDGKVTVGRPTSADGHSYIRAPFAVDHRGRIVLCGGTFSTSGVSEEPVALVRLLPDGQRDRSFGRTVYMERAPADHGEPVHRRHVQFSSFQPEAVAVDGRDRIVVTGSELGTFARKGQGGGFEYLFFSARRFLATGRRDESFGQGGVFPTNPPGSRSFSRAAVTQSDGKVVAGGWIQIDREDGNRPGNTAMLLTRYR